MFFFHSVLIEQWIRAKYERKEFLDGSRQSYISGHKDGMLWKQGKASSKFALRRFVLSETDNSLIYFNKPHVSTILPVHSVLLWGGRAVTLVMAVLACQDLCLQCFDAVGWTAGRASSL